MEVYIDVEKEAMTMNTIISETCLKEAENHLTVHSQLRRTCLVSLLFSTSYRLHLSG